MRRYRRKILAGLTFGASVIGTVLALAWRGLWADVDCDLASRPYADEVAENIARLRARRG